MNIFVLHEDQKTCARMHNDKHVVKMILEYAQLLSTAHRVLGSPVTEQVYKKTHVNHPCAVWVRESADNYYWLYELFLCLCVEYTHRYGKVHLTQEKLEDILKELPNNLERNGLTPFPQAMPDEYKSDDVVTAYRNYYLGEKTRMFNWKNRPVPEWVDKAA